MAFIVSADLTLPSGRTTVLNWVERTICATMEPPCLTDSVLEFEKKASSEAFFVSERINSGRLGCANLSQ